MTDYRAEFIQVEDEIATFKVYKDEKFQKYLKYHIEKVPTHVDGTPDKGARVDDQFRPEFDDDGNIVTLHYDEELTEQKLIEAQEAVADYREMLEDN